MKVQNIRSLLIGIGASLLCCSLTGRAAASSPQSADFQRSHVFAEGERLVENGKYAEAEALARMRLPETESRYGAESLEVGEVLDVLVESLWRGGKAKDREALLLGQRALAVKEKALGPEHAEVAACLNNLANVLRETGDYGGARRSRPWICPAQSGQCFQRATPGWERSGRGRGSSATGERFTWRGPER